MRRLPRVVPRTAALVSAACLAGPVLASPPAAATAVLWSSRAAWESAVGSFDTEDFETTANPPGCTEWMPGLVGNSCAHEIVVDAPKLDVVFGVGAHPDRYVFDAGVVNGSREVQGDLHRWSIFSVGPQYNRFELPLPIVAFGVDVARFADSSTDFPGMLEVGGESFPIAGGTIFIGVTSDEPFSSLTLHAGPTGEFGMNMYYHLDDVSFAAVPEPATACLLAAGLAALAAHRAARSI